MERWDETVENHQVVNYVNEATITEEDGQAIQDVSASLNDHGSINGQWRVRKARAFETWETLVDMNRLYRKTVWFRHASESDYKSLVDKHVGEFSQKVDSWISADRSPTSYDTTVDVQPEAYKNRFSGHVVLYARWSPQAAGQRSDVGAILAHAMTWSSKTTASGASRYHRDEHWIGRGKSKLDALISQAHGTGQTVVSIASYSFNPNDSTWSLTITENNW